MRMVMTSLFMCFVVATLVPNNVSAAELIVPLSKNENAAARVANAYFLKKHLYSSKRHRLVKVNVDALQENEPIEIVLFDDEKVVVDPISLVHRGDSQWIQLKAKIRGSSETLDTLLDQAPTLQAREKLEDSIRRISISAAKFEHDTSSGANFPFYEDGEFARSISRTERSNNEFYYGVRTRVRILDTGREYILLPLEMGGPYHLVYEVDKEKRIRPMGGHGRSDSIDQDMAAKRQARQDFMQSLGEDPRTAIIQARKDQQRAQQERGREE